jgi:hypothetical protein
VVDAVRDVMKSKEMNKKHVYREAKVMTALGVDYIQVCENCGVPEGIDVECRDVPTDKLSEAKYAAYVEKALKAVAST